MARVIHGETRSVNLHTVLCARCLAACTSGKTLGRCSVLSRFCVFKGSPHRLPMAAWPRNVVKEHRAAAWVLYVFLLSLFITYASYTINHNLQRRDEPVVVEDVVEEAWTLPDVLGSDHCPVAVRLRP